MLAEPLCCLEVLKMQLLILVCLLLLGVTTIHQEATWNIKYENAGKKAPAAGAGSEDEYYPSESVLKSDGWSSSTYDENLTSLVEEISMQVYTDGSIECPSEDGTFYISGFCNFYIVCSNGYPEFFKCTNGMHFNPEEQKCDLPIRAGCELQCIQANGISGIPGKCDRYIECINDIAEEKYCPENLHFSQLHHSCVAPKKANCKFTCPENYGFYPLLGYCEEYVKCQDGEVKFQRCPSGLRFNNRIKMCDLPERATCIDNCPQPNGIFPVEGDHTAFINCSSNVAKVQFCEEGKNFNFFTSQCDPPETDDYVHKCPSPNGRFPLPGNRSELFIECTNDSLSIKSCPSQLHINPDTENCEY